MWVAGTELWRERLEGRASGAWVGASSGNIAGGVRGDNWSEGRLRDRWSEFVTGDHRDSRRSRTVPMKIEGYGTRSYFRASISV